MEFFLLRILCTGLTLPPFRSLFLWQLVPSLCFNATCEQRESVYLLLSMGDNEVEVAQSSTIDCASMVFSSSGNVDAYLNTVAAAGPVEDDTSGTPADAAEAAIHVAAEDSHADSVMLEISNPNTTERETMGFVGEAYNNLILDGAERTSMELNQTSNYDSNTNGNVVNDVKFVSMTLSGENGDTSTEAHGTTAEHRFADGVVLSAEEERLWSIVRTNSFDFNAWTSLIEETEKTAEDNIWKIRKVYDAFLVEFPLCYGYWKKYADHELLMGDIDKVVEIYERAVQGVTYSVDIWLHYCVFAISTYGDPDTIRRLFERGLAYVGVDYLSYPLWDKYIEYEYTHQEWGRLAMIYTRILENPNQQLDRYYNSFKELAGSRPLAELRSSEEAAAAAAVASSVAESQLIEGDIHPDTAKQTLETVSAGLTEAAELEKYVAIREEMYKKAKEFESKIIGFETAIRRPYFHVRPLNDAELENWHNYLDFIEREGNFDKVVKLYERCLVACANYPEYWIRYILCMEASASMDLADNALARATKVFVKRQPEIHLFAACFKEQHADIPEARAAYHLVHTEISPGLLEAIINHANMEKRLGNMEGAFSLYEQAIAIEKGKEHSQTLPMLFAQYSRFVFLGYGNAEKARQILVEALELVQLSKPILEALLYLESIQSLPKRIEYLDSLVDKFIMPNPDNLNTTSASIADQEELSRIFLEFLGLFGDAQSIKKARDRHMRFFLCHKSLTQSRKRGADNFLVSDKEKLAKSYSGISSTVLSVMGAYPGAQGQLTAGYVSQPQSWPQVTQAQGQPWNPGYAQQAAYGGYYGGSYTQPQLPTIATQTAAYSAYPPTYPVQMAYPQQTYAAPVTAAPAPAPAQPPAAALPAYYGNYY
ncbi:hypothetical protein Nepgr_032746 [Nepenthes gracilis]|uniref:Pre-mRNA-processing factor 39 n=1 Tax=Nepenthes gracilis TaxID=150966 RepID=A0AAD3TJ77_NEPGR|nr:hypothetical protein Nepgr_032746 [Nepenthes gracilis]